MPISRIDSSQTPDRTIQSAEMATPNVFAIHPAHSAAARRFR